MFPNPWRAKEHMTSRSLIPKSTPIFSNSTGNNIAVNHFNFGQRPIWTSRTHVNFRQLRFAKLQLIKNKISDVTFIQNSSPCPKYPKFKCSKGVIFEPYAGIRLKISVNTYEPLQYSTFLVPFLTVRCKFPARFQRKNHRF